MFRFSPINKMKLILPIFILFLSLYCLAQSNRQEPLVNPYLRTDMNANFKNITNINNAVFYKNGSNLVINFETILTMISGESVKLVDKDDVASYLYVSNGVPYVLKGGDIKRAILDSDNFFIRQYDPLGIVSNLNVISELKILYPSSIDDSDYSVTYPALTNGALTSIRLGRYLISDSSGLLLASNTVDNTTKQLAP